MTEHKPLKYYFGKELAQLLATKIEPHYPAFNFAGFVTQVARKVEDQELKARVETITDLLKQYLPVDYPQTIDILKLSLGPENKKETGMFKQYYWVMPIAFYVEKYGLDHFQVSIKMIKEITKRNTGEYAIRPYIQKYPKKTLAVMKRWSISSNFHLRRLASEGLRPRLPWARKMDIFLDDPSPVIAILENLKSDSSAFVRKSVANHLNDLLKDKHEYTLEVLQNWAKQATPETKWVIRHALRNELKKNNPVALKLIGT